MDKGFIYEGKYDGLYCVGCEEFKLESDLVDGNCKIHSKPVEHLSETNYFFKLSQFAEPLLHHYRSNPDSCSPESARNEVVAFLEGGLQDLSISRSTFSWGIPVPWNPEHVVYVWFDALLNYATAVGLGQSPESELGKKFAATWPADVHLVGRDILRFHAVIWPAMLLAAGLAIPRRVFAHGWLLVGGEKMSKSKLTGIAPAQITDHFGVDAFRYYFLRAIPFGSDGSFSWEDMSARYTSELANDFGNLASRATAMIEKYCQGEIPPIAKEGSLATALQETVEIADRAIDNLDFQGAILATLEFCKKVNGYLTEKEPWAIAKDPARQNEVASILYNTAESLRALAILFFPVMPSASLKLWESIGAASLGALEDQRISKVATWGQLRPGSKVNKGEPLFPRLEDPQDKE
jgi:methionyl-tRNA synthetase